MALKKMFLAIVLLAVLAAGAAGIFLWLRGRSAPQLFVRLEIASSLHDPKVAAINYASGEIKWKKHKKQRSRVPGVGGAGFTLDGEKNYLFSFPWQGASGFFCYFDLMSETDRPIFMELHLQRKGAHALVGRISRNFGKGFFIQKVTVRPGDRFELRWRGRGRIFVGRPLLYRILPPEKRKTIVMLAADTLRSDQIDARVGSTAVAPFLAKFSAQCARFEHCLSPSTWTLPSFMSLFTARNEIAHRINGTGILAGDQPFLVEALRDSFITVNFNGGLWMRYEAGFHRGFDIVREGGYFGDRKTVMAKSLLEGAAALIKEAEFPALFLFLHTYQVHTPYRPPAEFLRPIDPGNPSLVNGVFPTQPPSAASDPAARGHYFRLYQAGVSVLDFETGRFISALQQAGLYQKTMFILFGDHGEAFGEHGEWEHGSSLFAEQIHIPLLIRFPNGAFAGRKEAGPVSLLDVFPTLLDFEKAPLPEAHLDGVSLLPMLRSGVGRPEPVVSSLMNCWFLPDAPPRLALSFSRYKIIMAFAKGGAGKDQIQAYDLLRDPEEKNPLQKIPAAEWKKSMAIIREHRAFALRAPAKGSQDRKGMSPELLKELKTLGYL